MRPGVVTVIRGEPPMTREEAGAIHWLVRSLADVFSGWGGDKAWSRAKFLGAVGAIAEVAWDQAMRERFRQKAHARLHRPPEGAGMARRRRLENCERAQRRRAKGAA